jgi:signal transduction histidine kinase
MLAFGSTSGNASRVRSSRSFLSRLIGALFTAAPVILLLLVAGGLFAADRVLFQAGKAGTDSDAAEAAARVERFLDVHAVAMRSFHGLFAPPAGLPDSHRFGFLVQSLGADTPGLRRIWVADAMGIVVLDSVIDPLVRSSVRGVDIDTLTQLGFASKVLLARQDRRLQVTRSGELFTNEPVFVMISPVIRDGSILGMILGSISTDTMLAVIDRQLSPNRQRTAITAGGALIAVSGRDSLSGTTHLDSALIAAPDGSRWWVHVTHAAAGWPARIALWAVGIAAAATLIAGSIRERRDSRRIAERSQELEHLSTELLYANRAKSEFLANVSHELRTPLNAIVGFVDLLRDGVYGELAPRQIGPVDRIAASATHLRHLVDQVLDLAKITAGRLEVHTDVVDLRLFVLDVAGEMESLITERGLFLSLGVGTTLPRLRTDPVLLRQILVNLLGNAIKYTNAGTITIRARAVGPVPESGVPRTTPEAHWVQQVTPPSEGMWVAVQVADTGIGIAENDRERIFDEFEQVGAGPRGESMQRGTGLGLSISRRLARLLGGEIAVDSHVGKGSTFTLWIPVDPAELRLAEAP